ncbi:uncharacterized protein [Amphiura filiformis]|uniref:uncharacterized protein n=1 Tax=Amphiura filiformis TaxID=82378 RepID=UPI003B2271C8
MPVQGGRERVGAFYCQAVKGNVTERITIIVMAKDILGSNRWGQDGQLFCSDDDPHSHACQGSLFCLPHPYGCSCAAGFYGIDCDQVCPAGYFGAGCKLECHCATGVSCLYDTGECDGGQCECGWSGVNCQQVYGITCVSSLSRIDINGDDNNTIGVYKNDAGIIEVSFGRLFRTHNIGGDFLPPAATEKDILDGRARLLTMRVEDTNKRIGVFYCDSTKNACPSSKWGPRCTYNCSNCLNGGICDERSGVCVCAPGFIGNNCQTVLGSNRWGQDGSFACSRADGDDPHSTACKNHLFCLPHPYGCSCAAGFHGIDCDQSCKPGYFGAGCKLECHCAPGVSCLYDTGECDVGQCECGWSGVNCQQPSAPTSFKIVNVTKRSISVSWDEPEHLNGIITGYTISMKIIGKPYEKFDPDLENENVTDIDREERKYTLYNLTPSTEYELKLSAKTEAGKGPSSAKTTYTNPATVEEFPEIDITDNFKFVVGDNNTYGRYFNAPLRSESTYMLQIGYATDFNNTFTEAVNVPVGHNNKVITKDPDASSIKSDSIKENATPTKVSGASDVKPTPELKPSSADASTTIQPIPTANEAAADTSSVEPSTTATKPTSAVKPAPRPDPIKLEAFHEYVQAKKEANLFRTEFETLPEDNLHPWSVAKDPANKTKNRYCNIVAYDHSRVVLTPLENVSNSDYINASFIDGMYKDQQYIACQGPNMASNSDFWRMVWQYDVRKIVMLTNLIENAKIKCDQYWPDKATQYGEVKVTPTGEQIVTNCVIRTFNIAATEVAEAEAREVYQYHFTAWPDMGVPQAPSLLRFMKRVNGNNPEKAGPIVVHCSAGVGRTGTYITVEAMTERSKQEGAVDVYSFVSKMRNNRMKMVQTALQYQFIFDVLVEAFLCNDTTMKKDTFQAEFAKLKTINPSTQKSSIEEQFEALEKITTFPKKEKCKGALSDENAPKNRCPDIVPIFAADSVRPYLMTQLENSTNYINAAYIDGNQMSNQHLVTQMPLPDTVADIWRMVYDYKFSSIVMLNTLDMEDTSMIKYWPDKGDTISFGPLRIECTEEDNSVSDVVERTFLLSNIKEKDNGNDRTVHQLALQNWPSKDDKPTSLQSVFTLIDRLNQWQKQSNNQRVVVHCINGVGASCAFLAIMLILEELDKEDELDVFQAVRKLRLARPQAVQNLDQYTFCYEAIQAHLDSSSGIYENYRSPTDQPNITDDEIDTDIYANVFT